MDFTLTEAILATLVGGGVGFLSGMFGLGGGFLVVPALSIGLRVRMELAVGAAACQALGPATTSLLARGTTFSQLRLPLTIAGGLLVGVVGGAAVLEGLGGDVVIEIAGRSLPAAEFAVLATYLVLLLAIGSFAMWEARLALRGLTIRRGWIAAWKLPPTGEFDEFADPRASLVVLGWFGLAVGFLSGLLGISGGLVLLPGLIYLLGTKTQQAVQCSLVVVWLVAAQTTAAHAWHDNIDLRLVAALLLGGTIGARIGSEFGSRLEGPQLRLRFASMILATASIIAARLVWLLT